MSVTVTTHKNAVGEVFTLLAGNNPWPTLLAANGIAGFALGHTNFSWRIESSTGAVAWAKKVMTATTDGESFGGVGEGDSEDAAQGRLIDGSLINFYGTVGDKLFIRASNP